jgi:hypothetical protein
VIRANPTFFFLTGGTGNQLFQIAYAKFREQITGDSPTFLSPSGHRPHGEIPRVKVERASPIGNLAFKLAHRRFLNRYHGETGWSQVQEDSRARLNFGYHQTHVYLDRLNSFPVTLPKPREVPDDAICVHIRRGDYRAKFQSFGLLGPDYYSHALEKLGATKSDRLLIASDEPVFSMALIRRLGFGNLSLHPGTQPLEIISTSQNLRRFVMSNSTLSWWMANTRGGDLSLDVVRPSQWFRDREDPIQIFRQNWKAADAVYTSSSDE